MQPWDPEDSEWLQPLENRDDIEYVRPVLPKYKLSERYNRWRHQRMLDGDYRQIENVLNKILIFPAACAGAYAALMLLVGFTSSSSEAFQTRCLRVIVVCGILIGLKFLIMWTIHDRVKQYCAELVDSLDPIERYDDEETDDE